MPNDINKLRRLMRSAHALKQAKPDYCWRANLSTAWRFERLRKAMQSDVICFVYRKKDGSQRMARGTLCPKFIPFKAQPKGNYEAAGNNDPLRFNYYDIDALWWRSFYIDAFIGVTDEETLKLTD
jgi:hypothetical protein